jgi:hypothetical protein
VAEQNRPSDVGHLPGWREALGVGAVVVAIVLGLAVITSALPASAQDVVFRTPLAIVIMVVGTAAVLVRAARRRAG